jgi:hypothetical protein
VIDDDRALHRIMRGAATVWPDWRPSVNEPTVPGWKLHGDAPWPADIKSLEFFAWLVQSREVAQRWVPSYEAMQAQIATDGRADQDRFEAKFGPSPSPRGPLTESHGSEKAVLNHYYGPPLTKQKGTGLMQGANQVVFDAPHPLA